MKSVFIWCFLHWVGEEAERKDSDSGDCDYACNCKCVVECWWEGKNSLEWMCAGGGEDKNNIEWISCRCFLHGHFHFWYA